MRFVAREPVVVELVRAVGEALAVRPADRCQLFGGERLGHQHVVVHGHGHQAVALEERGEHVRAEGHGIGDHPAVRGHQGDRSRSVSLDPAHQAVLVDLHPQVGGDAGQLCAEPRGVHASRSSTASPRSPRGRSASSPRSAPPPRRDRRHRDRRPLQRASRRATRAGAPRSRGRAPPSARTARPGRRRRPSADARRGSAARVARACRSLSATGSRRSRARA